MNRGRQQDPTVFTVARFQACTAELREAVTQLRSIEQELLEVYDQMRADGDRRERLLVARAIIGDVQAALSQLGGHESVVPSGMAADVQVAAL